jgi:hypothetical protein
MEQRKDRYWKNLGPWLLASAAVLALAGCRIDSSTSGASAPSGGPAPSGTGQNQVPLISGNPPSAITAGAPYTFQPSASDPDGDALSFQISNLPSWAMFNPDSGAVNGTPTSADVGMTSDIVISVSDGLTSTALAAFSIAVTQISTGSATISWLPPTENTDGSALTDLAGFRIYYGTSPSSLTQTTTIANPGLSSYMVENLAAATWYFTVRAFATDGSESTSSNIASKTIQ